MSEVNKLEQLRDLVFGQEMESYDKNFKDIESRMDQQYDSVSKKILSESNELTKRINEIVKQIDEDLLNTHSVIDENKVFYTEHVNVKSNKIINRITELGRRLSAVEKSLQKEINNKFEMLTGLLHNESRVREKQYVKKSDIANLLSVLRDGFVEKDDAVIEQKNRMKIL